MPKRRASIPPPLFQPKPTAPPAPPIESGPSADARESFSTLTQPSADDEDGKQAFIANKWQILRTHPDIDPRMRALVHGDFASRLAHGAEAELPPVPGGVGYGPFYESSFKTGFKRGTSLYWHAVCPTPPSGNVDTFLYVTATNRAALGIEAFVSYNGQDDTRFRVFDWARADHWQTDVRFVDLAAYLRHESVHGQLYQTLPIWNSTYEIAAAALQRRWRNEALLYNNVQRRWDLVYRYDYDASEAQQKTGWVGSWGPIVETFQVLYQNTEAFGTTTTMLVGEGAAGAWGTWHDLDGSDSTIREDHVGFHVVFIEPNHQWVVRS